MVAACYIVRKRSCGPTSSRFTPSNPIGNFGFECLVRVELSNAIGKFSLKVAVVADAISNAEQVPGVLTERPSYENRLHMMGWPQWVGLAL